MKVSEAKSQVLDLCARDLKGTGLPNPINPNSPDLKDPNKFSILTSPARPIHRFNGWHVSINLDWFEGEVSMPIIRHGEFYWYAFAIPKYSGFDRRRYFICDYLQIREWVLDFNAPLGVTHRDHKSWRADLQVYQDDTSGELGYFRWGDEPIDDQTKLNRIIKLDNILDIIPTQKGSVFPKARAESQAHLKLKEFVASNPSLIGLSEDYQPIIEYSFCTGDHVDVFFEGPGGSIAVIEIELEGRENLLVGAHQAIKYRSLATSERRYSRNSEKVLAILVAFNTDYPEVISISDQYDLSLFTIDPDLIF